MVEAQENVFLNGSNGTIGCAALRKRGAKEEPPPDAMCLAAVSVRDQLMIDFMGVAGCGSGPPGGGSC